MKYLITNAIKEDLKRCSELVLTPELEIPDGTHPSYEYLLEVYESEIFLVAKYSHEIVGFLLAHILKGSSSFLDLLVVDPKHRGEGVGHLLIEKYKRRLKDKNIKYVFLFATESNPKTIKFYLKEGFIKAKHKYEFFAMNL